MHLSKKKPEIKASIYIAMQLLMSSLTGYAFQRILAWKYGASAEKSIFDLAFSMPTTLLALTGLGMSHAIFVTLFTRQKLENSCERNGTYSSLLNWNLVAIALVTLATIVFLAPIVRVIAPGFTHSQQEYAEQLILYMLPLTFTLGLGSYFSSVSIAYGLPISQEFTLVVARMGALILAVIFWDQLSLLALALFLSLPATLGIAGQYHYLKTKTGLKYSLTFAIQEFRLRDFLHQLSGLFFVAIAAQLVAIYIRRTATLTSSDLLAVFGFASSIVEPIGAILGKTGAFAIGRRFSEVLMGETQKAIWMDLTKILLVSGLGSGVIVLFGLIYSDEIIRLLYHGGAFSEEMVSRTSEFMKIMLLGVPFSCMLWAMLYGLLSIDRHSATIVYLVGYCAQYIFILLFFENLNGDVIAWSYPLCLGIQALLAVYLLSKNTLAKRLTKVYR